MIKFTEPEIKVMSFAVEDVITTSGEVITPPVLGPDMPPVG